MKCLIGFDHGLGDAAQFTVVLQHLERYKPDWEVTVCSLLGKHSLFNGLCKESRWVRTQGEYESFRRADHSGEFDRFIHLDWPENGESHAGEPSTKVEKTLREVFNLHPDPEIDYHVNISGSRRKAAADYLRAVSGNPHAGRFPVVLIHYQGNTGQDRKNIDDETMWAVLEDVITDGGPTPVILDWDRRSPLVNGDTVHCPGQDHPLWMGYGTGDGETIAALIAQSALFIGIDSGPLHIAAATETPSIGVWRGHHPVHFISPAKNILHLVPAGHGGRCNGHEAREYFHDNYRFQVYDRLLPCLRGAVNDAMGVSMIFDSGFWVHADNVGQDRVVIADIFERDGYKTRLQLARFEKAEVIVDIGSHIGVFAKLAHMINPSAKIICVEACPENLDVLRKNVGSFAEVVHAACTYEEGELALLNAIRPNCTSTGGSTVVPRSRIEDETRPIDPQYWRDARPLAKVTLEDLMERFGFDKIDILKLDCEGSEHSILGKTPSLDRIGFAVGEYHGRAKWDKLRAERLADWKYGHMYADGDLGTFHLVNPNYE